MIQYNENNLKMVAFRRHFCVLGAVISSLSSEYEHPQIDELQVFWQGIFLNRVLISHLANSVIDNLIQMLNRHLVRNH